jgi:hypothetical protein
MPRPNKSVEPKTNAEERMDIEFEEEVNKGVGQSLAKAFTDEDSIFLNQRQAHEARTDLIQNISRLSFFAKKLAL